MPRALLSVSDKSGVVDLGRGLAARGFELVSTGGTARALTDAGLAVINVSALTGFPEMMDGRVKTLHPALHGGILARRDRPDDLDALKTHGLGLVDVVVVNLYPFVKAAANPDTPFDALIEEIDIAACLRKAGISDPDEEGDDAEEDSADIAVADQTWETTEASNADPAGGSYAAQAPGAGAAEVETRPEIDKMASEQVAEATKSDTEESNEAAAS